MLYSRPTAGSFPKGNHRTSDPATLRGKGVRSHVLVGKAHPAVSSRRNPVAQQDLKASEKFWRRKANRFVLNPGFSSLIWSWPFFEKPWPGVLLTFFGSHYDVWSSPGMNCSFLQMKTRNLRQVKFTTGHRATKDLQSMLNLKKKKNIFLVLFFLGSNTTFTRNSISEME